MEIKVIQDEFGDELEVGLCNPPETRTWQTRTTKEGYSYQATNDSGKWYCQHPYGFCGGAKQALEFIHNYHPEYHDIIVEQYGSGLAKVLLYVEDC